GSHALKAVLASSSCTLFTAGKKINRQSLVQARIISIIRSNENVVVKTSARGGLKQLAYSLRFST
ncbi:hypothetical protein V1520DRAFT_275618, partial [Lipomyces starkeyi]